MAGQRRAGPGLFIAIYDLITNDIGKKAVLEGSSGIQVKCDPRSNVFRSSAEFTIIASEELDASQIKFADDLIALTVVDNLGAAWSCGHALISAAEQ